MKYFYINNIKFNYNLEFQSNAKRRGALIKRGYTGDSIKDEFSSHFKIKYPQDKNFFMPTNDVKSLLRAQELHKYKCGSGGSILWKTPTDTSSNWQDFIKIDTFLIPVHVSGITKLENSRELIKSLKFFENYQYKDLYENLDTRYETGLIMRYSLFSQTRIDSQTVTFTEVLLNAEDIYPLFLTQGDINSFVLSCIPRALVKSLWYGVIVNTKKITTDDKCNFIVKTDIRIM